MNSTFLSLCPVLAFLGVTASHSFAADRPSVVVLFADDAGYADFGFQPNVRPDMAKLTPHIDSIAAAWSPMQSGLRDWRCLLALPGRTDDGALSGTFRP